jgi:RNA polymerase sigma-70 factor (ECF subfamily)
VIEALQHPGDFQLAQNCLEGDESAIYELQNRYRPVTEAYLRRAGATEEEVGEVTGGIWSDCLAARPGSRPRLANYNGHAALHTWLRPLVLNRLMIARHRRTQWEKLHPGEEEAGVLGAAVPAPRGAGDSAEMPLLDLMREALQAAFMACPAEDFVLLQLAHADGLRGAELARMFGCSMPTISRHLERAGENVAAATLAYIRRADPWLELKWEDFVELCRVASPVCFGME